jgi:hypothetical protein
MATDTTCPLLIYLPGLPQSPRNSARRVADILATKASKGPDTFTTADLPSRYSALGPGRRINRVSSKAVTPEAVLDVIELDYRPKLKLDDNRPQGSELLTALRRFGLALVYFFWALGLVISEQKHAKAKTRKARFQLLIGYGSVVVLFLSVLITLLAILASLGIWRGQEVVEGTALQAWALGLTAFTTWLYTSARPLIQRGATLIQQLLEYTQNERYGASVSESLGTRIDQVLAHEPDRHIFIFSYSLGSLVALDYLFPRRSLQFPDDPRLKNAIHGFISVGCPADFIRL